MVRVVTAVIVLALAASAADPNVRPDPLALLDAGHYKRARGGVEALYRASPNDPDANYLLARVVNAFGHQERALELAARSIELNPRVARYHVFLAELYGNQAEKANLFQQVGLARKVKAELEQALALEPKNWQARLGLVQFYLSAPRIIGGDKKRAQEIADDAVRDDPTHGWTMQARIAVENKERDRVEDFYLRALKEDPESYSTLLALANYYAQPAVRRYEDVEKMASRAMRVAPDRSGGYSLLAVAYINSNRIGEVDAILLQAEKVNPEDWAPYYVAARTLITSGQDFDRAEKYLRKYLSQEPEGGAPKHAQAHWRLGQLYQKSGKKEQAIAEYEACLRADPDFEEAKKDLKKLR